MAALAASVFAAAVKRLIGWWKEADLQTFGVVLLLFGAAAIIGAAAFLYSFGFFD